MAFGVKVKLEVDQKSAKQIRGNIQEAIENATQNSPIKIRHLSVELGKQEAQRISKQLESAVASTDLKIKIGKFDVSQPLADLKKELTNMLSGLSVTGLKDILGTDGVDEAYNSAAQAANKLADAQEKSRQKATETKAALQEIKVLQASLSQTIRKSSKIEDGDTAAALLESYKALSAEIARVKELEGEEQRAAIANLTTEITQIRNVTAAKLAEEEATRRQTKANQQAASQSVQSAAQEANLARRVVSTREQISKWIENNTKAYANNREEVDLMLDALKDESSVTKEVLSGVLLQFEMVKERAIETGDAGKGVFEKLKEGWEKLGGWSIVTKSLQTIINSLKSMVSVVQELDSAMTELKKVTDLTDASYTRFMSSAAQMAKGVGATMADTINSVADFSRLGYDLNDATALAEAALIYKNVGDGITDVSVATESLISTIKAFGYEASEAMSIVDAFNEVGKFLPLKNYIGQILEADKTEQRLWDNTNIAENA